MNIFAIREPIHHHLNVYFTVKTEASFFGAKVKGYIYHDIDFLLYDLITF